MTKKDNQCLVISTINVTSSYYVDYSARNKPNETTMTAIIVMRSV